MFKLNGNTQFVIWVVTVIFLAGGLSVKVIQNSMALKVIMPIIQKVLVMEANQTTMMKDVDLIKKAVVK